MGRDWFSVMPLQTTMLTDSQSQRHVAARSAVIVVAVVFFLVGTACEREQFGDKTVTIDPSRQGSVPIGDEPDAPGDFNKPPVYRLSAGQATRVAEQTVPPSGGRVTVNAPGSPADGLSIEIPPGSYDHTVNFTVSEAPVESFDSLIPLTPISPVFTIENGGEYSRDLMKITIPAKVADGHFAMPLIYEPKTGALDGMPVLSINQEGVTAVTRHFCQILLLQAPLGQFTGRIDSFFRIGKDSWPFPNQGSWWSPGGICSGMSLGAIWYFQNHARLGMPRLHFAHDTEASFRSPNYPWDDTWGLRFASRVQVAPETAVHHKLSDVLEAELKRDSTDYYANAWLSLLVNLATTLQPQYVSVFPGAGGDGHAMVAWAASVEERRLHIYDPNFPNEYDPNFPDEKGRYIEFTDTGINGYVSANRVDDEEETEVVVFDQLFPTMGVAVVDQKLISRAWADRGKRGSGTPPPLPYQLMVERDDGTEEPLVDGFLNDSETLKVKITGSSGAFLSFDPAQPAGGVVPEAGASVSIDTDRLIIHGALQDEWNNPIPLGDGENLIGLRIEGVNQTEMKTHRAWLDFRWIRVIRASMMLSPSSLSVAEGTAGTFRATLTREAPAVFAWYLDDAPLPGVGDGPEATMYFEGPGDFTVRVEATVKGEDHVATAESRVVVGTIDLKVNKTPVAVGEKVQFSVETSRAPTRLEYTWRLPDRGAITGTNPGPTASFNKPGNPEVRVDVRDQATGMLWGSGSVRVAVVETAVSESDDSTRDPKEEVGIPDTMRDISGQGASGSSGVNAQALQVERKALKNRQDALILQNKMGTDEFKRVVARIKQIDRLLGR